MLEIKNLTVEIEKKTILQNININFELWKNYCILWQNWSWKSSLSMTIMWNPNYNIINGEILLNWDDIKWLSPDKRAKLWIFLAFQNIPEIPWVKLFEFLRNIYNSACDKQLGFIHFKRYIIPLLEELKINKDFLWRDLNVWFSWWERKKLEVLQLKLLNPKFIILDEIDSWLDINSFKNIANILKKIDSKQNSIIIITHRFELLEHISSDKIIIMEEWKISKTWDQKLIAKIKKEWF